MHIYIHTCITYLHTHIYIQKSTYAYVSYNTGLINDAFTVM